ncbi:Uncharacterised protein [Escherichia coli]|nr:Uncharacterised protein [Escherichia coli]
MKKFINVYIKSDYDIVILRLSVIIIFMLFGPINGLILK